MANLLAIGELFVAIAVAGVVARRIGLSVIPLYVLAGMLIGPNVAGAFGLPAVPADATTTLLAELGIVLLLFFLGLEFSIDRLLATREKLVRAGVVDLVVNFPVGVLLGLALGWTPVAALLLGGVVYISSSAIITKSLIDLGWIADPESEPILGVLVFEDLVVAVYLAVVTSLVRGSDSLLATAQNVGVGLAFLLVLALLVARGAGLFESVLRTRSDEAFLFRVLSLTVPIAGAALTLGVSEAVAAFFVGMGVGATDHLERVERLLSPIRDLFAAIFFFWIGASTDPRLVAGVVGLLFLALVLTTPTKLVSGFYAGRVYDLSRRRSVRVGTGMVTRGEFSLVIAAVAATGTGPVLREIIPAFAVGYVLLMSIVGTLLMQYADRLDGLLFRDSAAVDGVSG